jgi:hypothetical protein
VNVTIAMALEETPESATIYEFCRDATLRLLLRHTQLFMRLGLLLLILFILDILVIVVFFWGAVMGIGIIDRNEACNVNLSDPNVTFEGNNQWPPMINDEYVADYCNLNHYMFNLCIKGIMCLLTYINIMPLPWRIAIAVDAFGDTFTKRGRHEPPGLDLYDRPTDALWFHIPRGRRALIGACACSPVTTPG